MSNAKMVMAQAAAASTLPETAWNLEYAYYDPPESLAWNVSTAISRKSFSVSTQEANPTGLFFKPDGLKMYVIGYAGDDVNEYNLSTAWDVSTATFLQNFSVAAQETLPQDLFFKPDGTKMYIVGYGGVEVNEYNLSTAWDVSSATFLQLFSVSARETLPYGLFFKPDGTKMYIVGTDSDAVIEYNLSNAWDISSATFLQSFSVAAQDGAPTGLFFKPDGLKMYVTGLSGRDVNEYNLSTAWDVSTASFLQSFSIAEDTNPEGVFLKPDGTTFYIVGRTNETVFQYTLGGFNVAAQDTNPSGLSFKSDGLKMYIVGQAGDAVYEYDLSTAWDISTATFLQSFSVAAQEGVPEDIFFKPDGTKMYIVGNVGDDVNEYDLSTAWDVSSATFLQRFSVAAQETVPTGVFFKPDGTKMYVVGISSDSVLEYNLSTAWDISSATFLQGFSVGINLSGVFFKPDGTKMYVVGISSDSVLEYNLSTAWDVSTATFIQNFSVNPQAINPEGVFFKPDGTQMFVVVTGTTLNSVDYVFSYALGVQE